MGDEREQQVDPGSVALAALGASMPRLIQPDSRRVDSRPPNDRSRIVDIVSRVPGDPTPLREWGDSVSIPQGSQQDIDPDDRPDVDSAWGRRELVRATDNPQQLARVILAQAEPLELSIDVLQPPLIGTTSASIPVPTTVWAVVDYGAGSASAKRTIRCDDHIDLTIVACFLSISIYIGDLAGVPVASKGFANEGLGAGDAQVAVQVARGTRGLPYVNSQFLVANAVEGVLSAQPMRALSVQASLSIVAAGQRFLLLVDQGTLPIVDANIVAAFPLGTTPSPGASFRYLNPRGFSQGVIFANSISPSSALVLGGESVHIELEKQLL